MGLKYMVLPQLQTARLCLESELFTVAYLSQDQARKNVDPDLE